MTFQFYLFLINMKPLYKYEENENLFIIIFIREIG